MVWEPPTYWKTVFLVRCLGKLTISVKLRLKEETRESIKSNDINYVNDNGHNDDDDFNDIANDAVVVKQHRDRQQNLGPLDRPQLCKTFAAETKKTGTFFRLIEVKSRFKIFRQVAALAPGRKQLRWAPSAWSWQNGCRVLMSRFQWREKRSK